jgi:hypothetical protein
MNVTILLLFHVHMFFTNIDNFMRSESGYVKILLDLFQIDYAGDIDKLTVWKAKSMIKTVVPGDLKIYQMFRFYHKFCITNPAVCSDLSFKQATVWEPTFAGKAEIRKYGFKFRILPC